MKMKLRLSRNLTTGGFQLTHYAAAWQPDMSSPRFETAKELEAWANETPDLPIGKWRLDIFGKTTIEPRTRPGKCICGVWSGPTDTVPEYRWFALRTDGWLRNLGCNCLVECSSE